MTTDKPAEIVVGEVVRLKSGGPDMTVVRKIAGPPTRPALIECGWFTNGDYRVAQLSPSAVEKKK